MPYKTGLRLLGVARNPANGFPARLLEQYLTHLNILGEDGTHPNFEAWYQEVRYARGPSAPRALEEAGEIRYKDVLDAAKVFNHLQETSGSQSKA